MKNIFSASILAFAFCLSTPMLATSSAQTSIYKAPITGPSAGTQRVALTYRASFDIPEPIIGEVLVRVPFPTDDEVQKIERYSFGSAMTPEKLLSLTLQRETVHGNRFLAIKVLNPAPNDELVFEYAVSRKEKSNLLGGPLKADTKILAPEKLYLIRGPMRGIPESKYADLASQIITEGMTKDEAIRAIYRYSLDHVDTTASNAANEKIDRFIARAANIAAKPENGILVPAGKGEGEISHANQTHTWTNLFHPHRGWIPIDAFEGATKKRYADYYLGSISSDHITFGVGDYYDIMPSAFTVRSLEKTFGVPAPIPMKMKISFKRLPTSNPMITEKNQSSGVE